MCVKFLMCRSAYLFNLSNEATASSQSKKDKLEDKEWGTTQVYMYLISREGQEKGKNDNKTREKIIDQKRKRKIA